MGKEETPSRNLMQVHLEDCIADIQAIEKELDVQFKILGENIDAGFAQIGMLNKQCLGIARSVGDTFGRKRLALGLSTIACVGSAVLGAMEEVEAAKAHNEALDKLLTEKEKIANEKLAATVKLAEKAAKVEGRLRQLVDMEANKEFPFRAIKQTSFELQLSNMSREMEIYRVACYTRILVDFLCAEYRAWKSGLHCSKKKRPSYWDANLYIAKSLSPDQSINHALSSSFFHKGNTINGKGIYFATDASLLSPVLCTTVYSHPSKGIGSLPKIQNACARNLIKGNAAYKSYKRDLFRSKYGQFILFIIPEIVIVCLIVLLFRWLDWATWLEWTLGIVGAIAAAIPIGLISEEYSNPKDICRQSKTKQKKLAGFVKIYRPNFEKKSEFWAGVNGVAKGILSLFK